MRRSALLFLALALAGCGSTTSRDARNLVDQGYLLGSADSIKRLYWAKQALEAPHQAGPAGKTEYYTWLDSDTTPDGRRLAPDTVAVPVFVPAPAPSGTQNP